MDTARIMAEDVHYVDKEAYTIEDIEGLPEGQRAELIDGRMYMMATPSRIHQKIVMELAWYIKDYIRNKGGECDVYPAPFAVYLNKDSKNYVEPDICVVCDKDKLNDKGCNGAPDWVIEIVSPGNPYMDYVRKLLKYGTAGVREYWLVDYAKNLVTVYNFEHEEMVEHTFSDIVKAGIYEDLEIDFASLDLK